MSQVISYGGIDEGNVVFELLGSHGDVGKVGLTNNFKFCPLN